MTPIFIPFRPDQAPRLAIEEALSAQPAQSCPVHPDEPLEFDLPGALRAFPGDNGLAMSVVRPGAERPASPGKSYYAHPDIAPAAMFDEWRATCLAPEDAEFTAITVSLESWFESLGDLSQDPAIKAALASNPDRAHGMAIRARAKREAATAAARASAPPGHFVLRPERKPCAACQLACCGVPPVLQHAAFDRFDTRNGALAAHLAKCREFAASPRGIIRLTAMNGNGKTFLAAAICRAVLDRMTPLFLRHGTLMKRHRQRYELGGSSAGVSADVLAIRREGELKRLRRALGEVEALAASRAGGDDTSEEDSEAARLKAQISELEAQYAPLASASNTPALPILDACQQADLLVLDDIGRLQDGRDAEGVLHEVLDYRYNYRKPTIITVNKPEAQLAEFLGSAIFDRLEEGRFARLEFGLSSFRSQPAVNAAYLAAPPPPPTRGQPYFAAPSSAQPSAPSRQPGSALPLWMQIKYLEAEIADHRANPDSGCDRFNVTREDAQELKALRAKLAALKKQA